MEKIKKYLGEYYKYSRRRSVNSGDDYQTLHISLVNDDYEKSLIEHRKPILKNIRLFGSNNDSTPAESNPDNIKVAESNYTHVKKYLLSNKITILGFRVRVPDCDDLSKDEDIRKSLVWTVRKSYIFGQSGGYPIDIMEYFDVKQVQKGMVDVKPYKITVDGDTEIIVPVLSKVIITFFIEPKKKEVPSRDLLEMIEAIYNYVNIHVKPKLKPKPKNKNKSKKKVRSKKSNKNK